MTWRNPAQNGKDGPRRITPENPDLGQVLRLIRQSFAYMDGRVDPPSSMHRLDLAAVNRQAETGEVWAIGDPVQACVFLTPQDGHLYLGKLAVDEGARGQGLARRLFELAEYRARALGLPEIILQSRVELTDNHAVFAAVGYEKVGETAHAGYDRPTSFTFRKEPP